MKWWNRIAFFLLVCGTGLIAFAQQRPLDTTTFVVLGDGLAAGMGDFSLHEGYQEKSFPAQVARQMGTAFPQPLIEPPGLGNISGLPSLPVRVPTVGQTTVRTQFPPPLFVLNLSVPGLRVAEALTRRPIPPLIQESDAQQTLVNFILGYPALILGEGKPLWTQLEYAEAMNPTLVLVALGYSDAVEAAALGNPALLTDAAQFRASHAAILERLKAIFANVIVATVPDPLDTAFFATLDQATEYVGAPPDVLVGLYRLRRDDLVTLPGLMTMGRQILAGKIGSLPPGSIVSAAVAQQVRERVQSYNNSISALAREQGAVLFDLHGVARNVRLSGLQVGSRVLTANFLGGFYLLNGLYPGITGHGRIANELLRLLNQSFGTSFSLLDLERLLPEDPAVRFRPAKKKLPWSEH